MPWQLLLDITIAILLAAFIGYAITLSRQLKELRRNREDMVKVITTFNEATARAEAGIPRLRKTAEDAGSRLDSHVAKAQGLRDDLAFMIERADTMAARLEEAVRQARNEPKASAEAPGRPEGRPEPRAERREPAARRGIETRDEEQRRLESRGSAGGSSRQATPVSAPVASPSAPLAPPTAAAGAGGGGQGAAAAGGRQAYRTAMRDRGPLGGLTDDDGQEPVVPRAGGAASAGDGDDFQIDDERSEAERELLRALQSAR